MLNIKTILQNYIPKAEYETGCFTQPMKANLFQTAGFKTSGNGLQDATLKNMWICMWRKRNEQENSPCYTCLRLRTVKYRSAFEYYYSNVNNIQKIIKGGSPMPKLTFGHPYSQSEQETCNHIDSHMFTSFRNQQPF